MQDIRLSGSCFQLHRTYCHTPKHASKGINDLSTVAGRKTKKMHLVALYKAFILSVLDYAILQLSHNHLNKMKLKSACL